MRKYARLREPYKTADDKNIYKIMMYEAEEGSYLFMYSSPDAVLSVSDLCYDSPEDLFEDWNDLIDENGWIDMEDPMPYCQHDAFIPIWVKGRDTGKPEWGKFEILQDGEWTVAFGTERLILRRWEESDAESLYEYAKDPDVGPIAGWPAHQSVDESKNVIKTVLNERETYAICLKEDLKAIGAISLKLNGHTDMTERDDECEMGYWLGKPFWGQGIMPEAVKEMLRHAFEDLGMQKVWIGYYEGNTKSKRVQEKCGFKYQWRSENVDVPLMHEKRTGHVSVMTREDWRE